MLETKFSWSGIICEPDTNLNENIKKIRKAIIIKNPIDQKCQDIIFFQSNPYNSSIKSIPNAKKIKLKSYCLNHLLDKFKIKKIDYLSLDTEGNEYDILKKFNFNKYQVKIITVEHNFTKNRNKIKKIMLKNNYVRKFKYLSYMDDWYVLKNDQS